VAADIFSVVPAEAGQSSCKVLVRHHDEKHAEEQLRLAGEVFQSSGEAIVITDGEMRCAVGEPAFTVITGYSTRGRGGTDPYSLSPGVRSQERDQRDLAARLAPRLMAGRSLGPAAATATSIRSGSR
jgi:PAS domain-containing protein